MLLEKKFPEITAIKRHGLAMKKSACILFMTES